MIKISHLTKIYRSKKRTQNKALDDISLSLDHAGLVFVLGKSGSGKSTLLNLLGGLDTATSGQINVDGSLVSAFGEKRLCDYRNSHIGFIFQDYHLIDELTVFENVRLSLNLLGFNQNSAVLEALEKVGLSGYENRFPPELSGGERQRVAIARAIVKKPRIILADEPTGNLDEKTATQIIDILKSLSINCLILTVSHNVSDAYIYADRIIELSKGRIIADHSRNPQYKDQVYLDGDTLVYPQNLCLNDQDIALIGQGLSTGSLRKIIKTTDKFIPTEPLKDSALKEKIRHAGLGFRDFLKLSSRFLFNKAKAIALSSFMVAVIMVIMALAQTIISFDANAVIAGEMKRTNMQALLFTKQMDAQIQQQLGTDYLLAIDQEDIQAFYDAGYKGTIHPVWNISLPITEYRHAAGLGMSYFSTGHYINETFGTLVTDEAFLEKRFGEVKYHAKKDVFDPAGVIITDYVADAIIARNLHYAELAYDDLLGDYKKAGFMYDTMVINGILDTGYQSRYEEILKKIEDEEFSSPSELYQDKEFMDLSNEIYEKLGYCYTLNENFVADYTNSHEASNYVYPQRLIVDEDLPVIQDSVGREYFVCGTLSKTRILDWIATQAIPKIPANAKYMRISYGTTATIKNTPAFSQLPVADKDCAHVVFSNGQVLTAAELNVTAKASIDPSNGELMDQSGYPNAYASDFIPIPEGCTITEFCTFLKPDSASCAFYDENKVFIDAYAATGLEPLPAGTVTMNFLQYNALFGTTYNSTTLDQFEPHTAKLTQYRLYDDACENPLFTTEVTISALVADEWKISDDVAELFRQNQHYINGLCFDGVDGIAGVNEAAQVLNYEHQSFLIEGISTMTQVVDVFVPIFRLVAVILCVGVVFILVSFSTKMIRDKMHEIGILKALGGKNATVGAVFGVQVVCIALLTCLLATVGYFLFIGVANDVLMDSLSRFAPSRVILDVDFLTFQPDIAGINCLLVIVMSALALLIPILKVRRIEPVKIIRTRE